MDVQVVALDIEGTVCPISFVQDVLFPYALSALDDLLASSWDAPSFTPYRDAFPRAHRTDPITFRAHIHNLVARDVKDPALKGLQGHLWLRGYESGALRCPLFPDVYPALARWRTAGISIVIYSSGSVAAQKMLFQYADTGASSSEMGTGDGGSVADLRPLLDGYFDTVNAGPKRERDSYYRIMRERPGVKAAHWLFLSDQPAEVDAALRAGMQGLVVHREGNVTLSADEREKYGVIASFDELEFKKV